MGLKHTSLYTERWNDVSRIATHLVVVTIFFLVPEFIFGIGHYHKILTVLHPIPYVVTFYLNYFVLVDKVLCTDRKNNLLLYICINMALVILQIVILHTTNSLVKESLRMGHSHIAFPQEPFESENLRMMKFILRDGSMMVSAASLGLITKMARNWREFDKKHHEILTESREMELNNLKSQLNPHFLFNTLNNIYSLISLSPEKAQNAVHELSNLLRYVLYENRDMFVPVDKEMTFVENYIELMRLRLNSNVDLQVDIDHHNTIGLLVAPLTSISLVENAFKHGISALNQSFVHIRMYVEHKSDDGYKSVCHITNSYYPKKQSDRSGSGIGLQNLKRQLEIIYPGKHKLELTHDNEVYTAHLEIDIEQNPIQIK